MVQAWRVRYSSGSWLILRLRSEHYAEIVGVFAYAFVYNAFAKYFNVSFFGFWICSFNECQFIQAKSSYVKPLIPTVKVFTLLSVMWLCQEIKIKLEGHTMIKMLLWSSNCLCQWSCKNKNDLAKSGVNFNFIKELMVGAVGRWWFIPNEVWSMIPA